MTGRLRRRLRTLALAVLATAPATVARAHPHVFVTATEEVLFGADGLVSGVRHTWRFDDMYLAFVIQGLGPEGAILTREQMAPLAKTNVESLAEFGYFTIVKASGKQSDFGDPVDYWLEEGADRLVTLHFTLPLKASASAGRVLTLSVYDPTYFVAFSLAEKRFGVVEPKDWMELNRAVGPRTGGEAGAGAMPGMGAAGTSPRGSSR